MSFIDEDEEPSFIQRHRGLAFLALILVLGTGIFFAVRALSKGTQSAPRQSNVMDIRLPPPPPPPKPVPTPTPEEQPTPEQQEQKMVEQAPVQDEKKPDPPKDPAPAPLGTGITGPGGGPDLGLGSGSGLGGIGGGGGGGGSKYGWYASQVQSRIADAIRNNPSTRKANLRIVVRIWPDPTGRITKARLVGTTGNASLDATLQNDILTGLQLADPPPPDMPMPINMRISAQRPQ